MRYHYFRITYLQDGDLWQGQWWKQDTEYMMLEMALNRGTVYDVEVM